MSPARRPRPATRRAAKLAQLEADRNGASISLGMGPLSFDNNMARQQGWTNSEIAQYWEVAAATYQRIQRKMYKRRPELYDMRSPKDPVYIGPIRDRAATTKMFTEAEYRADAKSVVAHAVATGSAIVARADGTTRVVISIPPAEKP